MRMSAVDNMGSNNFPYLQSSKVLYGEAERDTRFCWDAIVVLWASPSLWKGLCMISEGLLPQGKEVLAVWVLGGRKSPKDTEARERKKKYLKTQKRTLWFFLQPGGNKKLLVRKETLCNDILYRAEMFL